MSTQAKTNFFAGTKTLVLTALLAALIVLMAFTPIGYLRVGAISVSLLMIPVAIGALSELGAKGAAILGTVFGITSFVQCFGMDAFGSFVFTLNPAATFIMCIVMRALAGFLTGLVGNATRKLGIAGYALTGLCGAVFNTVLFMGTLVICFWHNSDFLAKMNEWGITTETLMRFFGAFVGFNCIFEAVTTALVTALVGAGLHRAGLLAHSES